MPSAVIMWRGTARTVLFDEEDAHLFRQFNWRIEGKPAYPYLARCEGGRRVLFHREVTNCPPGKEVDHVNGDTLDDRRSNLRVCARFENARNIHATRGTSRYKGVSWSPLHGKWIAVINPSGRSLFLGRHDDENDAARAYDMAATIFYGEFARLNLPDERRSPDARTIERCQRFTARHGIAALASAS